MILVKKGEIFKGFWVRVMVFFLLWMGLGMFLTLKESPTFDERVHVEAGYRYWKGDFEYDPIEPPLLRMLVVLPTKVFGLAERPDYLNYRVVIIIITGILLSFLVGMTNWVTALLLLLEPNLLTHGHLVTTDAVSSILVVLCLWFLYYTSKKNGWMWWGGLAVAIKVSSMAYLGLGLLLMLGLKKIDWKRLIEFGLFCFLVVWTSYLFKWQPILSTNRQHSVTNYWGEMKLPLGGYLQALKENWLFGRRGQPIYFAGEIYTKGPWWKQMVVFLLKTPWTYLTMAFFALKKKENRWLMYLLGMYTVLNAAVSLHFGMRHQLVITLLVILMIGKLRLSGWVWVGVLVSLALMIRIWPFTYTYSNMSKTINIHSDADYDWGQGLIILREELKKRGIDKIQLGYFGNNNPEDYGLNYERIKDISPLETKPTKEVDETLPQVISVTCYQTCGYLNNELLNKKKMEKIGGMLLFR